MLIHRLQLAGSGRLFSLLAHLVRGDMLHSAAAEDGRRESMLKRKEQAAELPEIASAGHLWWSSGRGGRARNAARHTSGRT